jgi:hypothetical protein
MSWKLHEGKTTTSSRGVGSFAYSIVLKDSGPQISAEMDSVNDQPSTTSSSLSTVGRSIQQLLAQLSKPAKAPAKAAAKAPAKALARPKAPVAP